MIDNPPDNRPWCFTGPSDDERCWGPYPTREAAIQAARETTLDDYGHEPSACFPSPDTTPAFPPGTPIRVGRCKRLSVAKAVGDAVVDALDGGNLVDQIMDRLDEEYATGYAYDLAWKPGWMDALRTAITTWAEQYHAPDPDHYAWVMDDDYEEVTL